MKKLLLIHAIIEVAAGVVLLFKPDVLFVDSQLELPTMIMIKMYGTLAFTFGLLCFLLSKSFEYNDLYKRIMLIIMAFHVMIALQMYTSFSQGAISNIGAFVVHMVLAVAIFIVYMQNINQWPGSKESA